VTSAHPPGWSADAVGGRCWAFARPGRREEQSGGRSRVHADGDPEPRRDREAARELGRCALRRQRTRPAAVGDTSVQLRVPERMQVEVEVEVDGNEVELEIELNWSLRERAKK